MGKTLNVFHNNYSFFPLIEPLTDFSCFLRFSLWELNGVHGGEAHESVGASVRLQPPGDSHSQTSPYSAIDNPSKWPFQCFYQFMAPVDSAPGKQISLDLGVEVCQHLSSLMGLREVINFLFVQLFLIVKTWSNDFQALYTLGLKLNNSIFKIYYFV